MRNDALIGFFCILYGTFFWGLVWFPFRLLYFGGIEPIQGSALSFLIAAILALVFIVPKHYSEIFQNYKTLCIYASVGCLTNITYVLAVVYGEVVRSMLLFFMSPAWTVVLCFLLLPGDKFSIKDSVVALLSLLGGIVILFDSSLFNFNFGVSDLYALVAGIGFAWTNVLARKYNHLSFQVKSFSIWFGVSLGAFFLLFILKSFPSIANISNSHNLFLILSIGSMLFISTLIIQFGLPRIHPVLASPIFLFEIIIAAASSYFLANELLSIKDFIGGMLIIAAIFLSARHQFQKDTF